VVCLANANFAASLELRKIYPCPGKVKVGASTLLRIVDESGEEYLYPQKLFAPAGSSKRPSFPTGLPDPARHE
jgi:hypothetical protein